MTTGTWILAWLCLSPFCEKPILLPVDTFNSQVTCELLVTEMEKQFTYDTFVCIQERKL